MKMASSWFTVKKRRTTINEMSSCAQIAVFPKLPSRTHDLHVSEMLGRHTKPKLKSTVYGNPRRVEQPHT